MCGGFFLSFSRWNTDAIQIHTIRDIAAMHREHFDLKKTILLWFVWRPCLPVVVVKMAVRLFWDSVKSILYLQMDIIWRAAPGIFLFGSPSSEYIEACIHVYLRDSLEWVALNSHSQCSFKMLLRNKSILNNNIHQNTLSSPNDTHPGDMVLGICLVASSTRPSCVQETRSASQHRMGL